MLKNSRKNDAVNISNKSILTLYGMPMLNEYSKHSLNMISLKMFYFF